MLHEVLHIKSNLIKCDIFSSKFKKNKMTKLSLMNICLGPFDIILNPYNSTKICWTNVYVVDILSRKSLTLDTLNQLIVS